MQADVNFIEDIRNAVEDGKLELRQGEEEFIDSVEERIEDDRELTAKQRMWLDDIHERIQLW